MSQDSARGRLVLTLKNNEKICIGNELEVQLLLVKGSQARIAFVAPREMKIRREKIEPKNPITVVVVE